MMTFLYAAGRATRLGPAFTNQPKVLVEVGGKSLLEWHLQRLAELQLRRLVLVTGHQRERIAAQLPALATRYGVAVEEIVNPDFTEGSVLSFQVSLPRMLRLQGPVLLMDADAIYPTEMLRRLVGSHHRTTLLIDRNYSTDDDDPVLVPLRAGKPFDFRKKWTGTADQVGESVGFFKVDAADVPMLVEETQKRLVGQGRLDSYDEVLRTLVLAGRFECEDISGLPWTEIDFPKDVDYARTRVLPAILSGQFALAAP